MATKKAAAAAETAKEETTSAPAPAPERELPVVTRDLVFNFDEFVGYGKAVQSHLSDSGMPWSFQFFGVAVTHENDDCYIINDQHFKRGDAVRVQIVHRGADVESVTVAVTTTKDTGDFDNELKYLDKAVAMAEERKSTSLADISADDAFAVYKDHNNCEVLACNGKDFKTVPPGHLYVVHGPVDDKSETPFLVQIEFQTGPIKEHGINGLQNEHLLAVLIHRTQVLDQQFPCDENVLAIRAMKQAINAFQSRTANRQARGVEGEKKL